MKEKVKVVFEVEKQYIRDTLLALGFTQKDPKLAAHLVEAIGDEITIDYGQVEDVKPDEANQAKFVITVAAIGMAAHILDEKEKAEKTEKEQTEV